MATDDRTTLSSGGSATAAPPRPASPWQGWSLVTTLVVPLFALMVALAAVVALASPASDPPGSTVGALPPDGGKDGSAGSRRKARAQATEASPRGTASAICGSAVARARRDSPAGIPARRAVAILTEAARELALRSPRSRALAEAFDEQALAWTRRGGTAPVRRAARRSAAVARELDLPACARLARLLD